MTTSEPNSFTIVERAGLSVTQKEEMFQLLSAHFDGVTREQFTHDLAEKNWVVLIHREERLVGFSTLHVYESSFAGAPVSVVYSGDTIVAPEAWGSTALARGWITAVNQLRQRYPRGKYYWLLLTSGFRTYRFLPVFWREFFPRHDAVTPLATQSLIAHLAHERFGAQFVAERGIVSFQHPQRLKSGLKQIPNGRAQDPHVGFFLYRNPGHANGDELVCLTELCPDNLTAAGRRMTLQIQPA
jgi:hypothetical protein